MNTRPTLSAGAIALALTLGVPVSAQTDGGWHHYVNSRFHFAIDIPDRLLRTLPPPDNGDGRGFVARRGTAEGSAAGSYNTEHKTLADLASDAERRCVNHRASYRIVRANFMALSCELTGKRIFYTRSFTRGDEDIVATFDFSYLDAERAIWNPVVAQMSRSFQPTHNAAQYSDDRR